MRFMLRLCYLLYERIYFASCINNNIFNINFNFFEYIRRIRNFFNYLKFLYSHILSRFKKTVIPYIQLTLRLSYF